MVDFFVFSDPNWSHVCHSSTLERGIGEVVGRKCKNRIKTSISDVIRIFCVCATSRVPRDQHVVISSVVS